MIHSFFTGFNSSVVIRLLHCFVMLQPALPPTVSHTLFCVFRVCVCVCVCVCVGVCVCVYNPVSCMGMCVCVWCYKGPCIFSVLFTRVPNTEQLPPACGTAAGARPHTPEHAPAEPLEH